MPGPTGAPLKETIPAASSPAPNARGDAGDEPRPGSSAPAGHTNAQRASGIGRPLGASEPRLTGRGAIVMLFGLCLVGAFLAQLAAIQTLAGIVLLLACGLSVWFVRPADLLAVVVSPPLCYAISIVMVELIVEPDTRAVAAGTVLTLGGTAIWLFLGTALTVVTAFARGLKGNIQALGTELRGDRGRQVRPAPRPDR